MNIKNLIITCIVALFLSACNPGGSVDVDVPEPEYEYAEYPAVFYHPGFNQTHGNEFLSTAIENIGGESTVSFWFKFRRTSLYDETINSSYTLVNTGQEIICYDDTGSCDWSTSGEALFDFTTSSETYQHLAIVKTEKTTSVYLDDVLIDEADSLFNYTLGNRYIFVFADRVNDYTSVDYRDVAIFNFAATPQEITEIHQHYNLIRE